MELQDVRLRRDQAIVFAGLSMSLCERRIGLIGSNGSGKSSVLRLLKGLLTPDAGSVKANAASIGFVFQNPEHQLLFPTVMEELCFGLLERGVSGQEAENVACHLLSEHDLTDLADKAVHELSDGQKQLLCILSILVDGAETILLDEPCASLDLRSSRRVMAMVSMLPQQVVMATHQLNLLAGFDRVIWIEKGQIRGDGSAEQVVAAYQQSMADK